MPRFKHSGKMGDIVWSLPFIQQMGGGVLYLNLGVVDQGAPMLTAQTYESLKPFLEMQSGIDRVEVYRGEEVDFDLDTFRNVRQRVTFNLVDGYFVAFQRTPAPDTDRVPWLRVYGPAPTGHKVVVSRTDRYLIGTPATNPFYAQLAERGLAEQGLFVGFPDEHENFQRLYAIEITRLQSPNIAVAAAAIRDCDLWVGNENLIGAIAEGFKKTIVREIRKDREQINCIFRRPNLFYI